MNDPIHIEGPSIVTWAMLLILCGVWFVGAYTIAVWAWEFMEGMVP